MERAASLLRAGELVAFPTETVYGLGADARDVAAVRSIFAAKGRPADNPLIVHVAEREALARLGVVGDAVPCALDELARRFWPGPLTLVVPRGPSIPDVVTAGRSTVAVRVPDHPVARALLERSGVPVAAPSANRSGRPSPTRAEHVLADLDGRIPAIVDGGSTSVGLESTVLDLTASPPIVLRRGGVTIAALRRALGEVRALDELALGEGSRASLELRSPGLRHRHYAPRARVLLAPEADAVALAAARADAGARVGLMLRAEASALADARRLADARAEVALRVMPETPEGYARALYSSLRALDDAGAQEIVVGEVPAAGLGASILDRLRRAADAGPSGADG
ncbi:MAG: threonylcarbamoyl-AMP synthase [Myxococcales bacterium]|nr:threonylcarbamoyl-AMP synthase [Myxococcales bacterium]